MRIPYSDSLILRPRVSGIPETMVCMILIFMWSFGAQSSVCCLGCRGNPSSSKYGWSHTVDVEGPPGPWSPDYRLGCNVLGFAVLPLSSAESFQAEVPKHCHKLSRISSGHTNTGPVHLSRLHPNVRTPSRREKNPLEKPTSRPGALDVDPSTGHFMYFSISISTK